MSPMRREQLIRVLEHHDLLLSRQGRLSRYTPTSTSWRAVVEALDACCQPSPITRAQVEAVMERRLPEQIIPPWMPARLDLLIDDLLGLLGGAVVEQEQPGPSREALERILNDYDSREWHPEVYAEVAKRLLAWARGEAEKRWCEHCTFSPARDGHPAGYWYCWGTPDVVIPEIVARWACCPVLGCHKMRPT